MAPRRDAERPGTWGRTKIWLLDASQAGGERGGGSRTTKMENLGPEKTKGFETGLRQEIVGGGGAKAWFFKKETQESAPKLPKKKGKGRRKPANKQSEVPVKRGKKKKETP